MVLIIFQLSQVLIQSYENLRMVLCLSVPD